MLVPINQREFHSFPLKPIGILEIRIIYNNTVVTHILLCIHTKLFKIEPIANKDILDISIRSDDSTYRKVRYWHNNTWVIEKQADKYLFPYVRDIYRGIYLLSSKENYPYQNEREGVLPK